MDDVVRSKFGSLEKKKLLWGIVIVLGIALSWVGATQATKSTYSADFKATFFIVWFSTCWMVICFPLYLVKDTLVRRVPLRQVMRDSVATWRSERGRTGTVCSILRLVLPFCLLWIATNYMYAKALSLPDFVPADVTALFSSAPAFVFILSWIILKERVTALKLFAVPITITGVVLFQYADGFSTVSIVGSMLSVGAAIGAATYKTMFKRCVGDAPLCQVALFLTTLGLLNAVFLWIIFVILSATGAEPLTTSIPWKFLFASAILSLLFNFLINFGIAYTYPLFISLGTVVGIPLNAGVDRVFRDIAFGDIKIEGSAFIIVGFLMLLLPGGISDTVDDGFRTMFCLDEKCWPIGKSRRSGSDSSMTKLIQNDDDVESDIFG